MRRFAVSAFVLLLTLGAACSGEGSILERDVRVPDDEGTVTDVSLERIQIDGERTYRIGEVVESFATGTRDVVPLLSLNNKYVHIGLDGEELAWVAAIATVVEGGERAYYTGIFEDVVDGRAVFEDGTALTLGDAQPPEAGTVALITIDPSEHAITEIGTP